MILKGKSIYLRLITLDDTELIVNWRNRPDIMSMSISQTPFTKEGHESWYRAKIETGKVVQFIICELKTDKPIGSTNLAYQNEEKAFAEFSYYIGEPEYRGKGIGSEALQLTVGYGINELKLEKITAEVLEINQTSLNCFLSNGFVRDDSISDHIERDGKNVSIIHLDYFDSYDKTGKET